MKRFVMTQETIPECYQEDVKNLRRFIRENLNIMISSIDTYNFWSKVSESWACSWMNPTTHYASMTREEFLLEELERYGVLLEMED